MVSADVRPLIETVPKEPKKLKDNIAVWSEMKDLCVKYKALSLGEGAPNIMPPKFLQEDMMSAIESGFNQYTRTFGQPELVRKVAEVYGPLLGREVDPMREVLVSSGAFGALNSFLSAYLE